MTLRDLLHAVNAEDYSSIPLFQELLKTKPEYGSGVRIEVKQKDGELIISNVHVGSLGDMWLLASTSLQNFKLPKRNYSMPSSKRCRTKDLQMLTLMTSGTT